MIVGILLLGAMFGAGSDDSSSTTETETPSDPCELPSTFEVQSDPNVAPADEFYERCLDAVSEGFNQ